MIDPTFNTVGYDTNFVLSDTIDIINILRDEIYYY